MFSPFLGVPSVFLLEAEYTWCLQPAMRTHADLLVVICWTPASLSESPLDTVLSLSVPLEALRPCILSVLAIRLLGVYPYEFFMVCPDI